MWCDHMWSARKVSFWSTHKTSRIFIFQEFRYQMTTFLGGTMLELWSYGAGVGQVHCWGCKKCSLPIFLTGPHSCWEFQDPKMEVLYHIRPYFMGIFPYIGLKNRPKIYGDCDYPMFQTICIHFWHPKRSSDSAWWALASLHVFSMEEARAHVAWQQPANLGCKYGFSFLFDPLGIYTFYTSWFFWCAF